MFQLNAFPLEHDHCHIELGHVLLKSKITVAGNKDVKVDLSFRE